MDYQNNVLIIDDEPQIRKLLKISLEANGMKTFEAVNGREGLIQAASGEPADFEKNGRRARPSV